MPITTAMLLDLQEGRVSAFGDAIKDVMNEKRDELLEEGKKFIAQSIVESEEKEDKKPEGKTKKGDGKSTEESEGEGDEYNEEE